MQDLKAIKDTISASKRFWAPRNTKFKEWYQTLVMIDTLAAKGLESYVSNEPATFFDMAHFLLTRGDMSHSIPVTGESSIEYERRAKVDRACKYMWSAVDKERHRAGEMSFIGELSFFILVLGWYSTVFSYDQETGLLHAQVWNPFETYPQYANGKMISCVHSYKIRQEEAKLKADENGWSYSPSGILAGEVNLDDYWKLEGDAYYNTILIDDKPVTGWVDRPEMSLLVAPIAGYPDKGGLSSSPENWKRLAGKGIFEANSKVLLAFNKWKTQISQILRDTAQPVTEEFSSTAQATPEQLRERGALFHYAPGEQGLIRVPPAAIPMELQAHLFEMRRELQKGSFSDAVYGMMEGQSGYSLEMMAESSANQILSPYLETKDFVVSEGDQFWLSNLKTSKKVFIVKGERLEELKSDDIPEETTVIVKSEVATPKDWLERSTIANQLRDHLDRDTIVKEILRMPDTEQVRRRRIVDAVLEHPMTQTVQMIANYYIHADYLESRGDARQAMLFLKAAQSLETQLGVPPPGAARPAQATEAEAMREARAPAEEPPIRPEVQPPEGRGFAPTRLRGLIGKGAV